MTPSSLIRIRFSAEDRVRLKTLARSLRKPIAAIVRAPCRAEVEPKQLRELLEAEDVKRGRRPLRRRPA